MGVPQALARQLEALPAGLTDGVCLPALEAPAGCGHARSGENRAAEPTQPRLEFDVARAVAFGDDAESTGIDRRRHNRAQAKPSSVGTWRGRSGSASGDTVDVYAYGAEEAARSDRRRMPRTGIAGFALGYGTASLNLFVAPGAIDEMAAGRPDNSAPPRHWSWPSPTRAASSTAPRARRPSGRPRARAGRQARPRWSKAKQNLLDDAEAGGEQFTQLFGSIGCLQRARRDPAAREHLRDARPGAKDRDGHAARRRAPSSVLVGAFSLEGWMYALASSVIGLLAGLGVGRLIVAVASGIFRR